MEKRYIFHYDTKNPAWKNHCKIIAHDGLECSADIADYGVSDIVRIVFDDGFEVNAYVYELEEVIEVGTDGLVDKIASFFEREENWSALKSCWLENDRSEDLRRLLYKAIKE